MENIQSPIQSLLESVHAKHKNTHEGAVADYIPELGFADPNWFGIVVATVDGHLYSVGDVDQTFTIQSMSKAFTYALALQERDFDHVLSKVGVEPSGEAFNAISLDENGRPANPMINAGAIATTSLIEANDDQTAIEKIIATYSRFANRQLDIDEKVYLSESRTGHRNRAIGFMLRNFDIIEKDPLPILEDYFQQCSTLITCKDLAIMGATLANRGVNPLTHDRIIDEKYIKNVLSVMSSCGMYDYSGNWLYHVGLPAKSGVGGGIVTVLPGQMAIAVFSPPLDAKGNSCRGIEAVKDLSRELNLHVFKTGDMSATVIRASLNLSEISSSRIRSPDEKQYLVKNANAARIYQLRGYFSFVACEKVIRHVLANIDDSTRYVIADLSRVFGISDQELKLLSQLAETLNKRDTHLLLCDEKQETLIRDFVAQQAHHLSLYANMNDLLEWVEDEAIHAAHPSLEKQTACLLSAFALCESLDEAAMAHLESILEPVSFNKDDAIMHFGDDADALYFLTKGHVDIRVPSLGKSIKIASLGKGNLIGEMAIIDGKPRSADIIANSDEVECLRLSVTDYEALNETRPMLKIQLLRNIVADLADKLRHTSNMLYAQSRD